NDHMEGHGLSNVMYGDSGDDTMEGRGASNVMHGGTGNDTMTGIGASNVMYGNDGVDRMEGRGASNVMRGGDDNDAIYGFGANNVIHGDHGDDFIEAKAGVTTAFGGDGNDTIMAAGGVNVLNGNDGNDTIEAIGGVNVVHGDAGDDDMLALGGVNTMFGGSGDDRMKALGVANIQFGGDGEDLLAAAGNGNLQFGDAGNDQLYGLGVNVGQFGGDGEDVLVGVAGVNLQHGGAGKDKLFAVGGANIQIGGSDDDFLMAGGANNIQFGDHLWSAIPSDLGFDDDGKFADVIENFDEHFETEGGGTNVLIGGGTNNLQFGGSGKDYAFGAGGMTTQVMGQGDDVMVGGGIGVVQYADAGNDILIGGGQGVAQFGGDGSDVMVAAAKIVAPQYKAAASFQYGGAGTDVMLGLSFGDEAAATVSLNNDKDSDGNRKGGLIKGALPEEIVVTAQLGGEGADLMVASGPGTIVHGGADDDVALALSDTNSLVMGGAGDDLILSSSGFDKMEDALEMKSEIEKEGDVELLSFSLGNFFAGGSGSDVIMDISDFTKIVIHDALTDVPWVQGFRSALTATINAVEGISEPIAELIDSVTDFSPEFGAPGLGSYEVKANVTLGGLGADVLGGDGFLSGEAGDDTYTIWANGEATIAERATDGVKSFLESFDVDLPVLDDISQTPDGNDVIELRSLSLDAMDQDAFNFVRSADALHIELDDKTVATVHGMDDETTAVEWLKVVQGADSFVFDLKAIYDEPDPMDDFSFAVESVTVGIDTLASGDILGLLAGAAETLGAFGSSEADAANADLTVALGHGTEAVGTIIPETDFI
ncbi:Ca2+-binding RTX toxin-like protein, partial [Labrenzia sp. EL_195]|nr:Ca2+-binding RTX toxin-like protein [Labrenzia sp. EL_195]